MTFRMFRNLKLRTRTDIVICGLILLCLLPGCRTEERMDPDEAASAETLKAAGGTLQTSSIASNNFSISVIGIDFSDLPVGDAAIAPAGKLPYLRTLLLRGTKVTDAGLAVFKESQCLETVDFSHTNVSGTGLELLHHNFIKDLTLADSKFADGGMASLVEIGHHLVRLNLAGTKIADEDMEPIKNLRALEVLDLSRTAISGPSLRYLPGGLKELNLSGSAILDSGLARLEQFKLLETLDLSGTKITDNAIPHIQAMIESQDKSFGRRKFKHLNLRKTAVSDKAVAALKASAPDVTIER